MADLLNRDQTFTHVPRIRATRQAIGSARPGSQRLQEKENFSTPAKLEFNESISLVI